MKHLTERIIEQIQTNTELLREWMQVAQADPDPTAEQAQTLAKLQTLELLRITADGYVPASFLSHELPQFTHDHLASLAWLADESHNALQYYSYTTIKEAEAAAAHADQLARWLPFHGEDERWKSLAEKYRSQAESMRKAAGL